MIQEPLLPEDDILVWLALQKALKAQFPGWRFKLKEDASGLLTVLCHGEVLAVNFETRVKAIVAGHLGEATLGRTVVSRLSADAFDVIF